MRLGERSARVRTGGGGLLIALLLGIAPGWAQDSGGVVSVGPGRIVCNATFCEMAMEGRTRPRVRVIVSDLSQEETRRLRKCTGVRACVVTVEGTPQEQPNRIMATAIHWQD